MSEPNTEAPQVYYNCDAYSNEGRATLKRELTEARSLIQRLLDTSESPAHEKYGARIDARHWLEQKQPTKTPNLQKKPESWMQRFLDKAFSLRG